MRIFKYLIAETLKSQIAVLVVLMTIFVSQKFVRVLSDASEGDIPSSIIFQLLSLNLPALLALIIPLSLFLGIFIGSRTHLCRQRNDGITCLWRQ